jgi:hypothetical protein
MAIDAQMMDQIKQDWLNAPRGQKTRTVKKWAELSGCSAKTLYGYLNTGRKRKSSGRKIEGIEDYVTIVHQIKKKSPEQFGEISTDQATAIAIKTGQIPDFMKGKEATINRVGREIGMNKRKRRIQRFQAARPNQMHHVDASSSKFFYIHRELGDGDYVLRLHAGTKGYKNKPVPIRLRPWIYGLTDDHSGVFAAQYTAAYGESIMDNMLFLGWAWMQNHDKTFFGVPERIKGDKGPMMRGKYAQDFFDRMGVEIDPSTPENKESHGKIERPWRTVWQRFEKPFFACTDWKKFEISMSELNAQFMNFLVEYNNMPHRYEKNISRIQAWKRISLTGGAVAMPENALATVISRVERTVGVDGCFSIDNVTYEVKGLHDAKVWVFQGIFDDKVVVEDQFTSKKYETERFTPNGVGEFTGHKQTPHQKAQVAAEDLELSNTLYADPKPSGNVVQLPTTTKETITISDPLETNAYPSMEAATQDFISICGFVPDKENREAIEQLILENGLSRRFVTDLSLDVQANNTQTVGA